MVHKKFLEVWERFHGGPLDRAVEALEGSRSSKALEALQRIPVTSEGFLALIAPSAQGVVDQTFGKNPCKRRVYSVAIYQC